MLLDSESPKYLGNEEGLLNIELMRKLYHIIAYNLAKSRVTQGETSMQRNTTTPDLKYWNLGRTYWSETMTQRYLNLST